MSELKQKQKAFEQNIDTFFDHLINYLNDTIKNPEDQKVSTELVSIFNDLLITQLAGRGYIDMEGE